VRIHLLLSAVLIAAGAIESRAETTIGLAVSVPADATADQRALADSFLVLLELSVTQEAGLSVVERQHIGPVLQELALSGDLGAGSEARVRLGKLINADLLVLTELLPSEALSATGISGARPAADKDAPADAGRPPVRVMVRVVESLTGAIRGVTTATVDERETDESAAQIAGYVSAVARRPDHAVVTVAVAPFESVGRFERLRPLETGLRDMITTRLRRWSDPAERADGKSAPAGMDVGFQVLQRSNMRQLLEELDLLESGLVDQERIPVTLPARAAAFLVTGQIDERNDDGFRVVVSGQMLYAATGRPVREFEFDCRPDELPRFLASHVDALAGWLKNPQAQVGNPPGPLRDIHETELLFGAVVSDLSRFRRICPIDFTSRNCMQESGLAAASGAAPFRAGGSGQADPATEQSKADQAEAAAKASARRAVVQADSALGLHLLKKSIDRLESTLFIQPDRPDVAFALAFCRSFHLDGIRDGDRADELLRRAFTGSDDPKLQAAALRLLAESSFDHQSGQPDEADAALAVQQLLFAFERMPESERDQQWARLPEQLARILTVSRDMESAARAVELTATIAEQAAEGHRYSLAMSTIRLASLFSAPTVVPDGSLPDPIRRLERWAGGQAQPFSQVASRGLAQWSERRKEFDTAARWYLQGAEGLAASTGPAEMGLRDNFRIHAARCLRQARQPDAALELLRSFEPREGSLNQGYHGYELGRCLEAAGQPDAARDVWLATAQQVPGAVDNTDIVQQIVRLGGVPLRPDREIDVRYIDGADGGRLICRVIATNGHRLFCAGTHPESGQQKVMALDLVDETWTELTAMSERVTCMVTAPGLLWAGTDGDGLWRCDVALNQWQRMEGLPDARVSVLAVHPSGVYAGVGTASGGGVVRVTDTGEVTVLDGKGAPVTAPSSLVALPDRVLAGTGPGVVEFLVEDSRWNLLHRTESLRLFAGESQVWTSQPGREILPLELAVLDRRTQAGDRRVLPFQAAWYPAGLAMSGYTVNSVLERNGMLWLAGSYWQPFASSGFYRLDPVEGEFVRFGPGDGFRIGHPETVYAGVLADGSFWLATSGGLCRVTPRAD